MKTLENIPERESRNQGGAHLHRRRSVMNGPWPYLLFAVVAVLLYSNTFQSPFIFDDWYHIEANPHIRMASLSWDALREAAFESPLHRRPVAYITFALNYYVHGYQLPGYHVVNILIHLGAAVFLFLFLRATLSLRSARGKFEYGDSLALIAALIWMVHPLQVQSVTYLVQRMNSLAALFFILSMLLYVRARLTRGGTRSALFFVGAACSGVLALGSKENAAALPFFVLLYEWFFFQDLSFAWLKKRLLPILGVAVFLAGLALLSLGGHPFATIINSYGIRDFTMLQRVLTEFRVVIFYVGLLLFPYPGRLNIDHDFQLSSSLFDPVTTILSFGIILALFGISIVPAKRERLLSFCILWFLGNLVIESSVIGLEIIFEHRTYLPSMLGIFAVVLLGDRFLRRKGVKVAAALAVILLFSVWTFQRNMVWHDELTLRRDAAEKSPSKPRALAILANTLERNQKYDEAALYYKKTLSLHPRNGDEINYNLGNVLLALGKIDEAVRHFRMATALNPDSAPIRLNLAYGLSLQGRFTAAANELRELIRRHPRAPRAHNNLGILLMKQGQLREAVLQFSEALTLQPNYRQARTNLEAALERLRREIGR